MTYAQLLSDLDSRVLAEVPPLPLPDELSLQSLWFAGQFGRHFTDTRGRNVKIVQFGHWNRGSGPDFQHCSIEIDGDIVTGPIELDRTSLDWEHHGHGINETFDDVILHVVFEESAKTFFTKSLAGREIPRILISQQLLKKALDPPRYATATAHIGRCFKPLSHLDEGQLTGLLEEAARHRLANKAARLNASIDAQGWNEALWQAIARVLGYHKNSRTCVLLAQRLTIRQLLEKQEDAESLIFGSAGFLQSDIHENAPEDSQEYLRDLWERWWRLRTQYESDESRQISWALSGMRPANHPQRRLGALACLVEDWPAFSHRCRQSQDLKAIANQLADLSHSFWSQHHTLRSKATKKPLAIFGASRARDFLTNVLIPLRFREDETIWDVYKTLPASTSNDKLERALVRLFGEEKERYRFVKKAWQQQAILQIYHDFCLVDHSECAVCPFPEQLSQWR